MNTTTPFASYHHHLCFQGCTRIWAPAAQIWTLALHASSMLARSSACPHRSHNQVRTPTTIIHYHHHLRFRERTRIWAPAAWIQILALHAPSMLARAPITPPPVLPHPANSHHCPQWHFFTACANSSPGRSVSDFWLHVSPSCLLFSILHWCLLHPTSQLHCKSLSTSV